MDFTNYFEEYYQNHLDFTCVSVKLNHPHDSIPEQLDSVSQYMNEFMIVHHATAGKHSFGEAGIPHIHLHFIVSRYNKPSNPSQHRARWLARDSERNLDGCSFMYQHMKSDSLKIDFLAYSLKEGVEVENVAHYRYPLGAIMPRDVVEYLKKYGNTIFETQVALHLRQDKCSERKKLALTDLFTIVENQNPKTYRDMLHYLDEVYIPSLDLSEYPDPKNYQANCQKIAIRLKLLKYSDLIK